MYCTTIVLEALGKWMKKPLSFATQYILHTNYEDFHLVAIYFYLQTNPASQSVTQQHSLISYGADEIVTSPFVFPSLWMEIVFSPIFHSFHNCNWKGKYLYIDADEPKKQKNIITLNNILLYFFCNFYIFTSYYFLILLTFIFFHFSDEWHTYV
jgi:hypothetical protein